MMSAFRVEDMPIESGMLTNSLDEAQKKVERYFYDIRKQLFDYDQVLNSQREKVYFERRRALTATRENLQEQMLEYAELTIDDIVNANIDASEPATEWPLEGLVGKLRQYCYYFGEIDESDLRPVAEKGGVNALRDFLVEKGQDAYRRKCQEVDAVESDLMMEAERFFILSQTDNLWKEHLQAIKFVQQAVGLRGYAQKDPLIEYKLEGFNLYTEMMAQIRRNVIYSVYMFQPQRPEQEQETELVGAGAEKENSRKK